MPYSQANKKNGTTYFLHSTETESRGGKRTLFFFAREVKEGKEGTQALDKVPDGYIVTENAQTGLLLLKRDGEKKTEAEMTASAKETKTETKAEAKPAKETKAAAKSDDAETKPAAKKAPAKKDDKKAAAK